MHCSADIIEHSENSWRSFTFDQFTYNFIVEKFNVFPFHSFLVIFFLFSANGQFAAGMAVDGDATTGWYDLATRANATFTWTGTADDCITEIDTTNTALVTAHPNWGFESVVVSVLTANGTTVFTQTVSMTGSPDPNLAVKPPGGVVGRRVTLAFSGLETGKTSGGIAELNVKAKR